MAVKNYGIHDKWTDLDKLNNVDIKSVDGVIESVKINGEEAGSGSWQTVFEGSVETVDDGGEISGIVGTFTLTVDSIKATLNGTEYILPKTEHGYGAENESGLDFSTYPLFIAVGDSDDSYCVLWTPTAGTYTLKIEEPQSGGSSDFSTAEVTVIQAEESLSGLLLPSISNDTFELQIYRSGIHTVPLYKGSLFIMDPMNLGILESVSGNIEELGSGHDYYYRIYGDCTITIS